GDGTFQPKIDASIGRQPFDIAAGDFNHDGKIDLATANFTDGTASVLIGNGDGTFQPSVDYTVSGFLAPIGITAAPFGLSEDVSLAVTGDNGTFILLGNGDGTFSPRGSYAAAGIEATSGDLDQDGRRDLVVVSGSGLVAMLYGKGDGNFRAAPDFVTGLGPTNATVADVNEDGKPDLIIPNLD